MNKRNLTRRLVAAAILSALWILPVAVLAQQTQIKAPKNKYKVQDDVKIGAEASREVEKQFPILSDAEATRYIQVVGARLVSAIPTRFRQPSFDYRFKLVNASDINAFALPGGPMYVNRGMIEASKNEGEMAGVMAHEISHIALRHATAQQTKLNNPLNQILGIGAILGGAILGGEGGAQLGQVFAAGYFLRYSREYETQADVLGAQIMADAGYDPRDLANMFRTIAQQGGRSGGPDWLSGHPDPGKRYENINREASYLRVSSEPYKVTRDFSRVQSRLRAMPQARTMAEIQKSTQGGQGPTTNPTASGRYSNNVQYPSTRVRAYSGGNWIKLNVPSNWREFSAENGVQFAPEGGYGDQGITHGAMLGIYRGQSSDLSTVSREYVQGILQANPYLRQSGGFGRSNVAGRQGFTTTLSGRSPVTNRSEVVTVYTTQLNNGELLYIATVVPEGEASGYYSAFRNLISSVQLYD